MTRDVSKSSSFLRPAPILSVPFLGSRVDNGSKTKIYDFVSRATAVPSLQETADKLRVSK